VETYASEELAQLVRRLESLLERLGGDTRRIESLYRTAMRLELAFFEAAWSSGRAAAP